jgi:hypothetical protein
MSMLLSLSLAVLTSAIFFLCLYFWIKLLFDEMLFLDHVPFNATWNWGKVDNDEDDKCY